MTLDPKDVACTTKVRYPTRSQAKKALKKLRSQGRSGKNKDYVVNTVQHLRECGIVDHRLERLMAMLGGHRLAG